jgi:glycosyltransferase involved in cell wall biosynthesis
VILAVDCREFTPGRVTGIGSFLRVLLEYLATQHPEISVVAIIGADGPDIPSDIAACVHRLPSVPTLICDQLFIPLALRHFKADVLFSPYYKTPLFTPCPTAATIHDLIPVQFPDYLRGSGRLYAFAFRAWAGLLARRATAVITDSEFSRAQLQRFLRLATERIHVIPIGLSAAFRPDVSHPDRDGVLSRYGVRYPYLLTMGNFLPHKNLCRLVEAYAELPERCRQPISLVLAGTPTSHGPARPVDRKLLDRPGVLLPGFIAPDDLPLLYSTATAMVCPSLMEGFGLPVLEAMACGTPVICAQAGALPEVAGDAALYFDPTNIADISHALEHLLTDEPLRRDLIARGLARARLFDSQHTTARLVDLLETIATERRS